MDRFYPIDPTKWPFESAGEWQRAVWLWDETERSATRVDPTIASVRVTQPRYLHHFPKTWLQINSAGESYCLGWPFRTKRRF